MLGVRVNEVSLVPDDPSLLARAIRRAAEEHDLVLISGGLGPTADDHTVAVLARVFGGQVYRHPEAERRMRERALARLGDPKAIPSNYFKQAEVLEEAEVLLNPAGLAPGMWIRASGAFVGVLPGVPRELKALFHDAIVPRITAAFQREPPRVFRAKIFGHGESWAEARIQALGIDFTRVEYGISAKPGELLVKFLTHREEDHAYVDVVHRALEGAFREDLVVLPEGLAAGAEAAASAQHSHVVHEALLESGLTVATAESCTGGLIAGRLTEHAGSSAYFRGSIVAYANEVKERALGVNSALLAEHGAVSEAVCAAMAGGVRQKMNVDLALSVTGVAGPSGGTDAKPVGLVFIGLASGPEVEAIEVERHEFRGTRTIVREMTVVRGLEMLRRKLAQRGSQP